MANHKETVWIGSKSNVWHHTSHTAVDEDNATSHLHEEVVNQTIATIIALIQQNPLTNNGQWIWEQAIYSAKGQHYALSFTPEWEGEEPLLLKIYQGKHLIHQCVIDTARSIYLTWLGTGNSDFLRIFAERQCYQHIATKENVSVSAKVPTLNHLAEETAPPIQPQPTTRLVVFSNGTVTTDDLETTKPPNDLLIRIAHRFSVKRWSAPSDCHRNTKSNRY